MPSNNLSTILRIPFSLTSTNGLTTFVSVPADGGTAVFTGNDFTRIGSAGCGLYVDDAASEVTVNANGGTLSFDGNSIILNGIPVIASQQSAIANASALLTSVQSQLNLALAALRAHGLIAT